MSSVTQGPSIARILTEDVTVLMELSKSILKAVEDLIGYHVTMSNVAEVKECGDTFDHI